MTHLTTAQAHRLMTVPDAPESVISWDTADLAVLNSLRSKRLVEENWDPGSSRWTFTRTPFGAETARKIAARNP